MNKRWFCNHVNYWSLLIPLIWYSTGSKAFIIVCNAINNIVVLGSVSSLIYPTGNCTEFREARTLISNRKWMGRVSFNLLCILACLNVSSNFFPLEYEYLILSWNILNLNLAKIISYHTDAQTLWVVFTLRHRRDAGWIWQGIFPVSNTNFV